MTKNTYFSSYLYSNSRQPVTRQSSSTVRVRINVYMWKSIKSKAHAGDAYTLIQAWLMIQVSVIYPQ